MGRGTHDDSGAGACYGRTDPDLLCEDNSASTSAWLALIPMDKSGMIALGLACVGFGESCNCAVKHIASAQVAADLRGIARAGMSPSKSPSTESTILDEATFAQGFDIHRQLHVSQLAYIVVGEYRNLERRWLHRVLRSEEHTSELQSHSDLVCRLLLEKKKKK